MSRKRTLGVVVGAGALILITSTIGCDVEEPIGELEDRSEPCAAYYFELSKCFGAGGVKVAGDYVKDTILTAGSGRAGIIVAGACVIGRLLGGSTLGRLAKECADSVEYDDPAELCSLNYVSGFEQVSCQDDPFLACQDVVRHRCSDYDVVGGGHQAPKRGWCYQQWTDDCEDAYEDCLHNTFDACLPDPNPISEEEEEPSDEGDDDNGCMSSNPDC